MIPIENNSWDYVQGLIEKEINSAFKLRIKEDEMENFKTRKLDAADYHKDHPYMKSLDKALTDYFVVKCSDQTGTSFKGADGRAIHGEDYEEMKVTILNSLFHPQVVYDKRVESPNKR